MRKKRRGLARGMVNPRVAVQCCALRVSGLAKEAAQGHEVGSVAGSRPGYMYNTTHATGEVLLIDMTTLYTLASKIHSRRAEGGLNTII